MDENEPALRKLETGASDIGLNRQNSKIGAKIKKVKKVALIRRSKRKKRTQKLQNRVKRKKKSQ